MKHVDTRKLPVAQEEHQRQVTGLSQAGQTDGAIAAPLGLSPTGGSTSASASPSKVRPG
jgi:hypothetical protein